MKKRKPPKPRDIRDDEVYAGFDPRDDGASVYIGGPHYFDSAQIHVPMKNVRTLARYLSRMADWYDARKEK